MINSSILDLISSKQTEILQDFLHDPSSVAAKFPAVNVSAGICFKKRKHPLADVPPTPDPHMLHFQEVQTCFFGLLALWLATCCMTSAVQPQTRVGALGGNDLPVKDHTFLHHLFIGWLGWSPYAHWVLSHIKVNATAFRCVPPHEHSVIYVCVAVCVWGGGISYFAQNIHRHISEQLCNKGRVRVGWLLCRADERLRVVSQQGQANPTLCVPLMRVYNVFTHVKKFIQNHFNPKPVILVQRRDPTHHMLYLTTA